MALTSGQMNDIDRMCPVGFEYNIGNRLENMTTAGDYNDGTLTISGGTLTGGTLTSPTINTPTITSPEITQMQVTTALAANIFSTSITTVTSTSAGQASAGGFWRTCSGITCGVYKLSSSITAGTRLSIFNPSGNAYIMMSSAGTSLFFTASGASYTAMKLTCAQLVELVGITSVKWMMLYPSATGQFNDAWTTST